MRIRSVTPTMLRAAWWARRAMRAAEAQLAARTRVEFLDLPACSALPDRARRAVNAALARGRASCLVRAVVLQAWDAAHGRSRDLVIGVTLPSAGFRAHAWLDGDAPCHREGFHELTRWPAR